MSALPESLMVPIESLMNRGIRESTAAAQAANKLHNRSIVICFQAPDFRAQASVIDGRLRLRADSDEKPDVEITGTPLELIRLFRTDDQSPIREGQIEIVGDPEIAERFRELCRLAVPDLERQLSRVIGEPAAFQVFGVAQGFMHWARATAEATADHFSDILQEDSELLPLPEEIEQFNADVDEASDALARIEARLKHFKRRLDALHP